MLKRFAGSLFLVLALMFSLATVAQAEDSAKQTCGDSTTAQCDNPVEVKPIGLPAAPTPAQPVTPTQTDDDSEDDTQVLGVQQLPVTGAESVTIAAGGALLALAGFVLVRRSNSVQA